jgi:hypothetical protein
MGYRVHIFHRLIERAFLPMRVLLVSRKTEAPQA